MKQIFILAFVGLLFSSCKPILLNTAGRYYIKKTHNGGSVQQENYTVEVPFEIVNDQIILKVFTQQHSKDTLDFLFDTGSYSGVSVKVYEQFSGDFADIIASSFDDNRIGKESEVFLAEKLFLGDLLVKDFHLTINEYVNEKLDGVIGADFLRGKVFTFDLPNNKMLISDISPKKNNSDYRYKFKRSWDKRYSSKIKVADTKMKVNFDTGTTEFLKTNNDFNLISNQHVSYEVITRGTEGYQQRTFTCIQTQDLIFNKNTIDNAIIIKSADYNLNFLGTEILMENKVILDCNKNKLILQLKDEKIKLENKELPTYSFAIGWLKGLKVVQKKVEVNSIDLELFDEIIEINGNVVPESEEEIIKLLNSQKEKEIWNLIIKRDNKVIDVKVEQSILEF